MNMKSVIIANAKKRQRLYFRNIRKLLTYKYRV